ncbi:MAG: PHP domain-containing protein [Clostridia bacterium]|nr:PHP domain-containing protein [Clostridia bacterium]
MKTDLHCHTTVSDGSMTPAQLVAYAGRAGLDCIAVTDHDCLDGGIRAAGAAEEQHSRVKVIAGVELSTFDYKNGRRVHLLCYRPRRTKVLEEICRVTCESRLKAAMEMLEMISPRYPVDLETVRAFSPGSSSVFKQHIALALMHMGYDIQLYGSLFDSLFSR